MATMKDIAKMAGVSRGTVDRVLNNRGEVRAETAERIRSIARELEYVPDKVGQYLAVKKKNISIAVVLLDLEKYFFFNEVYSGTREAAVQLRDYSVNVSFYYAGIYEDYAIAEEIDRAIADGASGIITVCRNTEAFRKKISDVTDAGIPVITLTMPMPDCGQLASLAGDPVKIGRVSADLFRLIVGDHIHMGVINPGDMAEGYVERVQGLEEVFGEHGITYDIVFNEDIHLDEFESYAKTKEHLNAHPEINAIFLTCEAGLKGACKAIESLERELRPTIICVDASASVREMLRAGLVAVAISQHPKLQGGKALNLMFDYLSVGTIPEVRQRWVDVEVVTRESI